MDDRIVEILRRAGVDEAQIRPVLSSILELSFKKAVSLGEATNFLIPSITHRERCRRCLKFFPCECQRTDPIKYPYKATDTFDPLD